MSSKKFYSDLALAKAASFGHVSNIRRGELEDGISFLFSVEALELAVNMELVIRDITEYTKSASFMLITSYENPGEADVSKNLQALSNDIPANGTVSEILAFLSDSLLAALTTRLDEMDVSQASDFDDSSVMDQDYHDEWDDPHAATDGFGKPNTHLAEIPDNAKLGSIKAVGGQELKRALSKAKTAKLIVGLLPAEHRQFPRFISLAVRVSVLGLPSDVLEAWGLKSTEYLVLLIHFANGYPELAKYEALPEKQLDVQFRFGKCAIPKPSQQAATQAFFGTADGTQRRSTTSNDPKPNEDESTQVSAFLVNHMSAPINRQLNQDLHGLLRLRRRHRMSWSAVQKLLSHSQNDSCAEFQPMDLDEEAIINNRVPEALQVDYALDDEDQVSLPLVAMQFALRQLVRCTELCMACHEAMGEGLGSGSLKPYVCEKPLCLYQYLSLGFGPSIEHEIINNPLVVDVLVSLAYSAVISGRIRDFPLALSVTVPNLNKVSQGAVVRVDEGFTSMKAPPGNEVWSASVRPGQWFLVANFQKSESQLSAPASLQQHPREFDTHRSVWTTRDVNAEAVVELAVCRADSDTATGVIRLTRLSGTFTAALAATTNIKNRVNGAGLSKEPGWNSGLALLFDDALPSLPKEDQRASLALLMTCIPSVWGMRDWLVEHPGRALSEWHCVDRSLIIILTWIIASNRSHLVPDQLSQFSGTELQTSATPTATQGNKGVQLPSYLRFRFLQGAPGKERQFAQEVEKVGTSADVKFPTIFAWHGSPMGNWHSIIRTGLDFKTVTHGRAHGHGIYLSRHLATSNAYTCGVANAVMPQLYTVPPNWSNAELPLTSAFSLCEVINRPRDFVSSTPHYVINRIDWVQCRYLFFPFTQAVSTAVSEWMAALKKQELDDSVPQAPEAQLFDMLSRPVLVPWQAIPPERRSQLRRKFGGAEHAEEVSYGDDGRNEWGGDDLELLVGCDSATECPRKGETEPQSPVRTPSRETKVTPYFPGTLDLSSIPKLPEPSWATSSRQALQVLNREVKDIHRIQSKTAFDELGWSVNTEAIDNIFHWIVELHSFDTSLPLGQDMMRMGVSSIVLEIRFGAGFPMSPPFVRVVRPRFLPFSKGGGGHVTMGGAICSELLTNSGWSPALSMEKVLLQVRLGLCELDPAARLDTTMQGRDYNIFEAVEAYKRAAAAHGWRVPAEIQAMTLAWLEAPAHN